MPLFSERQGFQTRTAIQYRDELPERLRQPILDILESGLRSEFILEHKLSSILMGLEHYRLIQEVF